MAETKFEQWAIVELMGHVRMAGFVREVQIAGAGMLSVEGRPTHRGNFLQRIDELVRIEASA